MYLGGGGGEGVQCNITFHILKYINSSLIIPTAGDNPIIYPHCYDNLLSLITLICKGEEILTLFFKPAN